MPTVPERHATRTLGRRVLVLDAERADLDALLGDLVAKAAPDAASLRRCSGLSPAATSSGAAVSTPTPKARARPTSVGSLPLRGPGKGHRRRSAAVASARRTPPCGRIAIYRDGSDRRTRAYVERRLDEGRSKQQIIRTLKRYIAPQVFRHLPRSSRDPDRRAWPADEPTPSGLLCERSAGPPLDSSPPGRRTSAMTQ